MSHKQKTPEFEGENMERARITIDPNTLSPGTRIIIENTGSKVEEIAGSEMQESASFAEAKGAATATLDVPQPQVEELTEEAVDNSEDVPEEKPPKKKKSKKSKKRQKPKGDWETLKAAGTKLDEKVSKPVKAGLAGTALAGLPALYYGTGLSGLGLGTALSSLGALSLPVIGYMEGKKNKMGPQGALVGAASGAGLYGLAGGTLSGLGTALGAVGLPAGLTYAGYKIGQKNKKPVVGALAGAGAGILSAPLVSGALSAAAQGGSALSVLGGSLASLGSTAGVAGGVGLSAAGLYGLGMLNKKLDTLTFKPKGTLGTMAEGALLPVSALVAGGTKVKKGIAAWSTRRKEKAAQAAAAKQEEGDVAT